MVYYTYQRKLTNPFAKSKNAGIQRKVVDIVKNKERSKIIEAKMSTILKTSPVRTNSPFISNRPAQNKTTLIQGSIPNIMLRKTREVKKSIAPRILTNTIKNPH
jgi:hypothetical protein